MTLEFKMTENEYRNAFSEPSRGTDTSENKSKESETRAGRALALAMDIRKFEIDLYWKRATYFWTFIGASFVGYTATSKNSSEYAYWIPMVFASLGLVFSIAWFLGNKGSKFWQNNWEKHVDLLEDMSLGPLYKTVIQDARPKLITGPARYSVSKINQLLSLFIIFIWIILLANECGPICFSYQLDRIKLAIIVGTALAIVSLLWFGRTSNISKTSQSKIELRKNEFSS